MTYAAIPIPDELSRRLAEGASELPMEALPEAGPNLEPARPLYLIDIAGETLATALADPENGVLRVVARHEESAIDAAFFRTRLRRAHAWRERLGLVGKYTAYRLANGAGDDLPGIVVDRFGQFAVVYVYARGWMSIGREVARVLIEHLDVDGVVVKVRARTPSDDGGARKSGGKVPQEVVGAEPPAQLIVEESGVPYEVHLLGGLNVGLFTDMREHRRVLSTLAADARVLNTFAYTGALSVVAARAGARQVTSVDLAGGVLDWARQNFRHSGLDPDDSRFRFVTDEVSRFLDAEAEADARHDLIILDPPTVSAALPRQWSLKRDLPALITRAAALFPDAGGVLWLSANARKGPDLRTVAGPALARAGFEVSVLSSGGLPPDYPTAPGDRAGRYLQVHLLAVRRGGGVLPPGI